jgi:hypothetical protein
MSAKCQKSRHGDDWFVTAHAGRLFRGNRRLLHPPRPADHCDGSGGSKHRYRDPKAERLGSFEISGNLENEIIISAKKTKKG